MGRGQGEPVRARLSMGDDRCGDGCAWCRRIESPLHAHASPPRPSLNSFPVPGRWLAAPAAVLSHRPASVAGRRGGDRVADDDQELAVAAAVLERALGAEHFTALQREIGVHDSYTMSEAQAEAVVRMQLGQLAALERDEIFKEYNDLREKILGYERLLSSERSILDVIRTDLSELRDKYGD